MSNSTEKRSWAYRIDSWFRKRDWEIDRTTGGWLHRVTGHVVDHPPRCVLLFAAVVFFQVTTPSVKGRALVGVIAALLITAVVLAIQRRQKDRRAFLTAQVVALALFCLTSFLIVPLLRQPFSWGTEAEDLVFAHVLQLAALCVLAIALFARVLARGLLGHLGKEFQENVNVRVTLQNVELFEAPPKDVGPSVTSVVLAVPKIPFKYPLESLLPASAAVVFFQGGWLLASVVFVFVGLVLSLVDSYPRLQSIHGAMKRSLSFGGLWLTSVVVILLAAAWLLKFDYVRTVLEGAPWLVVSYVLDFYFLFWLFEYWSNRNLTMEMLRFLGEPSNDLLLRGSVPYPFCPSLAPCVIKDRRIQVHGSAKFVVMGKAEWQSPKENSDQPKEGWNFYDRRALFERLLARRVSVNPNWDAAGWLKRLELALQCYFGILNGVLGAGAVLVWFVFMYPGTEFFPRQPIVAAEAGPPVNGRDARTLLFENLTSKNGQRPKVILMAASGGGTRAALYTASVLRGLHQLGMSQNVRLGSGVSGGGVALAYFAAHHQELTQPDSDDAWDQFERAMSSPFIVDVLKGAGEPRILAQTSISRLLAESFERRFFRDEKDRGKFMVVSSPIGLILNSTLVGESPATFLSAADRALGDPRKALYASGMPAGSRLIFTNLNNAAGFPIHGRDGDRGDSLRYVVAGRGSVLLTSAAALNANFPPVFPNSPVELKDDQGLVHRYWVTDGGAEENRGEISLLYAVNHAIQTQRDNVESLPDIHLIVAEASGASVTYQHDQGLAGFAKASGKLANQLAEKLEQEVISEYERLATRNHSGAKFAIHFLPMPSVLRTDGGLGTNWMMPEVARLHPTTVEGLRAGLGRDTIKLTKRDIEELIHDLHQPDTLRRWPITDQNRRDHQKMWQWIEQDALEQQQHPKIWNRLRRQLEKPL